MLLEYTNYESLLYYNAFDPHHFINLALEEMIWGWGREGVEIQSEY